MARQKRLVFDASFKLLLVGSVVAVVALLSACMPSPKLEVKSNSVKTLNCTVLKPERFSKALEELRLRGIYKPVKTIGVVRIELLFADRVKLVDGDTVMAIYANRVERPVFSGPIASSFAVQVDDALSSNGGADSLRFEFYIPATYQVCAWEQDTTEPYWQVEHLVQIQFLAERTVDARTERPIAFTTKIVKR